MFKVILKILRLFIELLIDLTVFVTAVPLAVLGRFVRVVRLKVFRHKKPYLIIGIQEISANLASIKKLLEDNNVFVLRASDRALSHNIFYGGNKKAEELKKIEILFNLIKFKVLNIFEFWLGVIWFSHFYIIWHKSYLSLNLDFPLIRLSGAKLIIQHCGSEVRNGKLHDAIFDKYCPGIKSGRYARNNTLDVLIKIARQKWAEIFGLVVSTRNQATFQFGPCVHFFFSQDEIVSAPRKPNKVPIIIHAPSNRTIKRTELVIKAINRIKNQGYNFKFILIENKSNEEVIKLLLNADIIIDQPGTWPGRFGIEGCASSSCVISGNYYNYIDKSPSPILQFPASDSCLSELLKELLSSQDLLEQKMYMCWWFWKCNYSPEAAWNIFKKLLSGNGEVFYPLPDQKEIILSRCAGRVERFLINFLYRPTIKQVNPVHSKVSIR